MNVEIFTIFDQAVQRYMDLYPAPTLEFAIRGFKEACTTEGHHFRKYPEDYVLYHIGTFDGKTGSIKSFDPRKIANASAFVKFIEPPELEVG